jgi:hypothetical protein
VEVERNKNAPTKGGRGVCAKPCKALASTSHATPVDPAATTSDEGENVLHVCKFKSPKNKKAHRKGGQLSRIDGHRHTRHLANPRKGSATTGDGGSHIHREANKRRGAGKGKGRWREILDVLCKALVFSEISLWICVDAI